MSTKDARTYSALYAGEVVLYAGEVIVALLHLRGRPKVILVLVRARRAKMKCSTLANALTAAERPASRILQVTARHILLAFSVLACSSGERDPVPDQFGLTVVQLDTMTLPAPIVIAEPVDMAIDSVGRYVIADAGDKAFKILDPSRVTLQLIGRPGTGPGEFRSLRSGGLVAGGVFGFDMLSERVTQFDSDGKLVRTMKLDPGFFAGVHRLVANGDSGFIGSAWLDASGKGGAIYVYSHDGSRIRRFQKLSSLFKGVEPQFSDAAIVFADAAGGTIFSAVTGHDTILAHSVSGRLISSGRISISGARPIVRFIDLYRTGERKLIQHNGRWPFEGLLIVRRLVALDDSTVAAQLASIDYANQTDLMSDGAPVTVLRRRGKRLVAIAHAIAPGALLGKVGKSRLLVLNGYGKRLEHLRFFALDPPVLG
jgi:hypothetical protein